MRKSLIFVSFLVGLAVVPLIAHGATFKADQNYYFDPSAVLNDNLYAAGKNVSVAGTINGDLFTAGENVAISGPISGDLAAVGSSLNISNNIGGSVRVAGENVNIYKSTGGDLLAAGKQISLMSGSVVAKDAAMAGATVYINGTINGNVQVTARDIKLGPNAIIKGTLNYYSDSQATVEQGAVIQGATNFHKTNTSKANKGSKSGLIGFLALAKSLMIFVIALIMLYGFRKPTNAIIEKSVSGFWPKALRGFIVLVVVPIAIIISFITIIGAFLGIILALFYGVLIVIASVVSVLLFAKLSLKYLFKKGEYELNWWAVAIATLVFGLIAIIPFVGWIFVFIIFISALGSTADWLYKTLSA